MSGFVIAGVDPSIASTGVARVVDGAVTVVRCKSKIEGEGLPAQLSRMRVQAARVVRLVRPADLVVIEGPAFGKNNAQTHALAGFWWLLVHGLEKVAPVAVVQPATLKKFATGKGDASKDEVLAAAVRGFPAVPVNGNDVADALALMCLGAGRFGVECGGAFVSSGRAALTSVRWPEMRSARDET